MTEVHGSPGVDGGRLSFPDALFEPFRISGMKLQRLNHIALGNVWDYPYPELRSATELLVENSGRSA